MKIVSASDSSIIAIFGEGASLAVHCRVLQLFHRLGATNHLFSLALESGSKLPHSKKKRYF